MCVRWVPVDVKTDSGLFREAVVGCVEYEGRMYIETRNTHKVSEDGTRLLKPTLVGWVPVGGVKGDFYVRGSRAVTGTEKGVK